MEEKTVRGYKAFESDWTCRGKQYTCPGEFEEDIVPRACIAGMHFCEKLRNCFDYYAFSPETRIAEVEAYGAIDKYGQQSSTNKLRILRELSWDEVLDHYNVGSHNAGSYNTGNWNTGGWNAGNWNAGNRNAGSYNTGNWNAGNWNTGNWNAGDRNTGNWNAGDRNAGNWNTGDCNAGDCNAGDYNIGSYNAGDWNVSSFNSGCFTTISAPTITMFNRASNWTRSTWLRSRAHNVLLGAPHTDTVWVSAAEASDEEKASHPGRATTHGYLKTVTASAEARQKWWDGLSEEDQESVFQLPNFDPDIFKECTGIDVHKERRDDGG